MCIYIYIHTQTLTQLHAHNNSQVKKKKKTCYVSTLFITFYIQLKMNIPEIFFMETHGGRKARICSWAVSLRIFCFVVNDLDGDVGNTVTAGTYCL